MTVPAKLDKTEREAEETLVAGSPPKFVKLPTDSLVAEGETAIFECAVIGEPKPELKWFSDSGEIAKSERILVSVSRQIFVTDPRAGDDFYTWENLDALNADIWGKRYIIIVIIVFLVMLVLKFDLIVYFLFCDFSIIDHIVAL